MTDHVIPGTRVLEPHLRRTLRRELKKCRVEPIYTGQGKKPIGWRPVPSRRVRWIMRKLATIEERRARWNAGQR